jgi:tetratricopeptide (TPR) repeat protein
VTREDRPDDGRDRRIEPRIDWTRVIAAARTRYEDPASTWRDRWHWRWVAALAIVLVVLLVAFRQPLADLLWPETRVQALLDQAARALAEGRLDADDGTGARQLYEAAQALDTDRNEAVVGLRRVAQEALRQAAAALAENRFDEARDTLALARELQVPRAQADALASRLRAREAEHAGLDGVLQAATHAHAAGNLVGSDEAALPLYQRVLALQPTRLEALEGREDALSDLLQEAGRHLARNELGQASTLIAQAQTFDPGHVDLPQAQAALATALESRRRAAARDIARGRLASARAAYEAVLAAVPDDAGARRGLEQVGVAHAALAERQAADFRFDQARRELGEARALAPQSVRVTQAEQAVARAEQARGRLGAAMPTRERDHRVQVLLVAMAQAEAQGQWLTPPGESAYDKLRAAQQLAPDAAAVKQAAARLLPAVRRCFEDELRANRIRRAQACQQAWQTLQPRDTGIADARRRLAEKWIAVGSERLGAGDVAFAQQALEEARRLEMQASGLDAFAERVKSAKIGQTP